ncbi:hypothetical protein N7492_005767 [Penicillium capsulatum]|uniref:BSD domain-containing protein n=1 Tax=Penicillium capsulatum TaxID=69766 RepID=A0A9W9I9Z1_9EURO|nr:hypothetical protein N7492_005767 [Penicillium capsulatum]
MDIAYDHIQEEILTSNKEGAPPNPPWGSRIGGLWDNVRKQGESYYESAQQEYAAASEEAVKGFSDLRESIADRTKGLSINTVAMVGSGEEQKDDATTPTAKTEGATGEEAAGSSGEGFLSRFKAEAARRLKEIEKAEEAADEAIMRFGMNISQKLREAVSIVPPETDESGKLLFESKDADGKRVIHATRFDAQLHVIHSNLESFTKDPASDKFPEFKNEFSVDGKTDDIASHLEKYPELRSAMEKLVPETIEYVEFWTRYYFLRLVIETEEKKRKELLKGTLSPLIVLSCAHTSCTGANVEGEEEVGWDDDSDSESESPSTPQIRSGTQSLTPKKGAQKVEPRRSNDQQSQADSESSYDVVSGTASRTPGSPKEKSPTTETKADDSDDDWE